MTGREITAFSANDDKPLDLSNPPSSFTAVTRPETGAPASDTPEGWAPNIWENYKRMIAPLVDSPTPSSYQKEAPMPNAPNYTDFDGIHWGETTVSIKWDKDIYGNEERPGTCVLRYAAITAMYFVTGCALSISVDGHMVYVPCDDPPALMAQLQERIEAWWAKHD